MQCCFFLNVIAVASLTFLFLFNQTLRIKVLPGTIGGNIYFSENAINSIVRRADFASIVKHNTVCSSQQLSSIATIVVYKVINNDYFFTTRHPIHKYDLKCAHDLVRTITNYQNDIIRGEISRLLTMFTEDLQRLDSYLDMPSRSAKVNNSQPFQLSHALELRENLKTKIASLQSPMTSEIIILTEENQGASSMESLTITIFVLLTSLLSSFLFVIIFKDYFQHPKSPSS